MSCSKRKAAKQGNFTYEAIAGDIYRERERERDVRCILLSCRLASVQVGSALRSTMTAFNTVSTRTGGRENERISVKSFLFKASRALLWAGLSKTGAGLVIGGAKVDQCLIMLGRCSI